MTIIGFAIILSCKSNNNDCIQSFVDDEGYTVEETVEACEELESEYFY